MSKKEPISRKPPADVRRILRQESGFGCCACGNPILQYHHIVEFSDEEHHRPEDMMAVCPNHHAEITGGAIPVKLQRNWKENPHNIQTGNVQGLLRVNSEFVAVEAGSNYLVGLGFRVMVDEIPIILLRVDSTGNLLLSLTLRDEQDNQLLEILDNEWISGAPLPWDIDFKYNSLSIRNKPRDIALNIDAVSEPIVVAGSFYCKSQKFKFSKNELLFNGVVENVKFSHLGIAGISLVADTKKKTFFLEPDKRLGSGKFVSWPEPRTRLEKTFDEYRSLVNAADIKRNELCICHSGKKWKSCCMGKFR